MNLPKYRPGPVEYWIGEAITEFINGFIAGLGGGSVVGVGVGATQATTDLGIGSTPIQQLSISVAALVLSAIGNGLKRVIIWHDKVPFPNPWPRPSETTDTNSAKKPS
jgi:hypothetical protein